MSNIRSYRYDWVWLKSIGANPLLCKKQPRKLHENIIVFYKDLSEVKNDINNYVELREYFKNIFKIIGKTKKEIISTIGNKADHCFRFNSSQWSLPTRETYKEIEKAFNLKLDDYDELLKKYENENKCLNQFVFNPQMEKGKMRNKKIQTWGEKQDVLYNGALSSFCGKDNVNDAYYPKSYQYFSNANQKEKLHSTQKPVALLEYLIKTYTNEGEVVLDNCMGSGSTGVACINTNRNFIGIELDDTYFEIAKKRIEDVSNSK
jgi:DNA modification methylase